MTVLNSLQHLKVIRFALIVNGTLISIILTTKKVLNICICWGWTLFHERSH